MNIDTSIHILSNIYTTDDFIFVFLPRYFCWYIQLNWIAALLQEQTMHFIHKQV